MGSFNTVRRCRSARPNRVQSDSASSFQGACDVTPHVPLTAAMAASVGSALGLVSVASPFVRVTRASQNRTRRRAVDRTARAKAVAEPPSLKNQVTNSPITMWEGTKRLQTQVVEVGAGTTCIRSLDWDRDRFDIEFGLEKGTTYNSFVIKGGEKIALVDASHEKFKQLYIDTLSGVVDPKDIDYIVCSHTEPDHSGCIGPILELVPNATVVGSKVCLKFLEDLVQKPFKQQAVKGGDVIDLGGGHQLKFIMAPNLHWPDTMFSYDPATQLMYTCDAFGSHLCSEDVFDTSLEQVMPHYRYVWLGFPES